MNNSFSDMREHERINITISIFEASFSEWIDSDSMGSSELSNDVLLKGRVSSCCQARGYGEKIQLPENEVRILVMERPYSELCSLEGKFPLGMLQFGETETCLRVPVQQNLFDSITHNFSSIKLGEVTFSFSLPFVEKYVPELHYPIFMYGFHFKVKGAPALRVQQGNGVSAINS